ncbi:class A beta-lactamase [Poseidonocella sp. HB161398]|uniref:class A beta-lactamase n=1 Tax=Poseidonocella sp. HB161398 TaxID=2320855 RepID=UPI001107FCEB|nr:class A beta-lactamase [Poseidonocella sp. HB161398]
MTARPFSLPRLAAGLALGLSLAVPALAEDPGARLGATLASLEERLGARAGVVLVDTATGRRWGYRAQERFAMNSTVKVPVCGAILERAEHGSLALDDVLPVPEEEILDYAPVTEKAAGGGMAIGDLCLAALDMSDNTAANLLIDRLGGPQAVSAFLRALGDPVSRLDRREPALNDVPPGELQDTTTPAAMAASLQALFLGDALSPASRAQLAGWMSHGGVTGALVRAEAPAGWQIADKSGAGAQTRNLVALVTPPGRDPWVLAMYLEAPGRDFATRNAALREIGAAALGVIAGR